MPDGDEGRTRRRFLQFAGTAAVTGLAGCGGETPTATETDTPTESPTPTPSPTPTETETPTPEPSGGTLTYARSDKTKTLDPHTTSVEEDAEVIQQLYDTLLRFDPGTSTLQAGLATGYEVEGKTLRFTLRDDVTFHDGSSFGATDVVATYRRFVDESYDHFVGKSEQSVYGPYLLNKVEDVRAPADDTVAVRLKVSHAPILRNLATFSLSIISKAAIEGSVDLESDPVGTGPFWLSEWENAGEIRLSENADYWGDPPGVNAVTFRSIRDDSTRAQSLLVGQTHVATGLDDQGVASVSNSSEASIASTSAMNVGYLGLNMAQREAFRDRRVRRALNYAVDTTTLVEAVYGGGAVESSQPIPPGMDGRADVDPYPHDPERARSMLEEAGYGDGFEMELATFRNGRPYAPDPVVVAEFVRAELEDVGVDVTVNAMDFLPFLEYTASGKHDACILGWMTSNADPDSVLGVILHPGVRPSDIPDGQDWLSFDAEGYDVSNRTGWANRTYTELVDEAARTFDESARMEAYRKASRIAHEEAPFVFLSHGLTMHGVHDRVQDYEPGAVGGPPLERVRLDPPE